MKQLLIGCGNKRDRLIRPTNTQNSWDELITLDIDPACKPDVLHDLEMLPLPFEDNAFEEIHAYEVLEHLGRQGDWRGFFAEFTEYHRIIAPGGYLVGSCPAQRDEWVWGDPGHTRELSINTFTFLDQYEYKKQVGKTSMTDYRFVYKADFRLAHSETNNGVFYFALQAIKPARYPSEEFKGYPS